MGYNTHAYGGARLSGIEQVKRTDAVEKRERNVSYTHAHTCVFIYINAHAETFGVH